MTPEELKISEKLNELRNRNARLKLPLNFEPKLPLYSHQIMGLHFGIRLSNLALFYEMGLGKTATAIAIMRYRIEQGQVSRVLVVVPKSVMYTWEEEIKKHSNLRSVILHDNNWRVRLQKFKEEAEFFIINYDGVSLFYDDILNLMPDALILDESTRIKNPTAQRTKALLKLSKEIQYKMILTGTPVTNSPMDIFCQIQVLDPTIFNTTNYWQWRSLYFKDTGIYYPKWVPRHGTLETIQKKIYTLGVRFSKKECLDLPPKVFSSIYIELNKEQQEVYDRINGRLVVSLGEKKVNTPYVMTQLMKLNQVESGWIKSDTIRNDDGKIEEEGEVFDLGKNPKIEVLSDLFDDLLYEEKKIIVWTKFIHSLKLVEELCKKKKIGYVTYYGGTKESDKKTAVRNFQTLKKVKVFLAQVRAGAFGTTLTAADTAIYFELDDDVELYEQSQDRNHRISGEHHKSINYIHLLLRDGVGEKILKALREKKKFSSLIIERKIL